MSEDFDPYWEWLGIRADERPVDHYRLLGLERFTSDAARISAASDERMGHVRNFQTGPRGGHTQRLLNELAAARVCLLNPQTRKTYDDFLRGLAAASLPSPPAPVSPPAPRASAWRGGPAMPAPVVADPVPPPIAPPRDESVLYAPSVPAAPEGYGREAFAPSERRDTPLDELSDDYVPIAARPWFPVLVIAAVLFVASAVWAVGRHWGRTEVVEHKALEAASETKGATEPIESDELSGAAEDSGATKNKKTAQRGKSSQDGDDYPTEVVIAQEGNGSVNLTAASARWTSTNLELATSASGETSIVGWTGADDTVEWTFRVVKPDVFRVEVTYAAEVAWAGGRYEIAIDDATKAGDVVDTGGSDTFRTDRIFLPVKRSGRHQLTVRVVERKGDQLWALQSIRLIPQGISGKENRGK